MQLIQNIRDGQYFYDAGVDMAMQDYLIHHADLDDDILFPYLSEPKVQIGRYQNTRKEVDLDYAKEHDIKISRRDTGGGAIYIDEGSPAFCYIFKDDKLYNDYPALFAPMLDVLHDLGVKGAKMSGRNDIEVDGHKISGAAMRKVGDRVHAGYSLLIDVDAETMGRVLTPHDKKITSKGIDSIRSRVLGVRPYLAPEYQDLTSQDITNLVAERIMGVDHLSEAKRYAMTEEEWAAIDKSCEEKYLNWDWNYGADPDFGEERSEKFPGGFVSVTMEVHKGRIEKIKIQGDFFGDRAISDVEEKLVGCRVRREDLEEALADMDLRPYLGMVSQDELISLLI